MNDRMQSGIDILLGLLGDPYKEKDCETMSVDILALMKMMEDTINECLGWGVFVACYSMGFGR